MAGLEGLPAMGANMEPKILEDRSVPLLTLILEGVRSAISTTRGDVGAKYNVVFGLRAEV